MSHTDSGCFIKLFSASTAYAPSVYVFRSLSRSCSAWSVMMTYRRGDRHTWRHPTDSAACRPGAFDCSISYNTCYHIAAKLRNTVFKRGVNFHDATSLSGCCPVWHIPGKHLLPSWQNNVHKAPLISSFMSIKIPRWRNSWRDLAEAYWPNGLLLCRFQGTYMTLNCMPDEWWILAITLSFQLFVL